MADNRSALHQGQATERNVDSASARVGFDDLGGTVSGFMQVLFPAAGGWNFFFTPKEGDQVVVSRLPNGAEEGYIIGKVYTAGKMPQGGAKNIFLIISDDAKNIIRFDADKGTMDIVFDRDATLKFKNLDIEVKEHTHIKTKTWHLEVEESAQNDIGENVETVIGGNVSTAIAGNVDTLIDGNRTENVGGNVTEVAGGVHSNSGATVQHK